MSGSCLFMKKYDFFNPDMPNFKKTEPRRQSMTMTENSTPTKPMSLLRENTLKYRSKYGKVIGKINEFNWIGDEAIQEDKIFPYSVVAETKVLVLRVSEYNLKTKFPKDTLQDLKKLIIQKKKWI
jgi:hypothetical protein